MTQAAFDRRGRCLGGRVRAQCVSRRVRTLCGGFTLIELLIVIFILLLITATAIPLMISGVEGRKMREACRLVSSYFSTARTRALETGRPVGVMIERFDGAPNVSMRLSYVEVPPPYSGDYESSRAWIEYNSTLKRNVLTALGIPPRDPTSGAPSSLETLVASGDIRSGDQIKFNFQGRMYSIYDGNTYDIATRVGRPNVPLAAPSRTAPWILLSADENLAFPRLTSPEGISFQIFRRPLPGSGKPLQLPEGAVIDLDLSGGEHQWGMGNFTSPYATNPIVLFSPGGAVNAVFDQDNVTVGPGEPEKSHSATTPIYLHIGRRAGASDVNQGTDPKKDPRNLYDLNNFWVGIGYQTGLVTSSENGAKPLSEADVNWPVSNPTVQQITDFGRHLQYARGINKSGQAMGGR